MVKSRRIFSPQEFVEALTGRCYCFEKENTLSEIKARLKENFIRTRSFPLEKLSPIVKNRLNVVLVDVSGFNERNEWVEEFRWFEVKNWSTKGLE